MSGKVELYKDHAGEFKFRLKAGNEENILASESYPSKSSCSNGIVSVRKNVSDNVPYQKKETKVGKYMFNLKAANRQVIGTGQSYTTASGRDKGIESVKNNAPDASIDDLS